MISAEYVLICSSKEHYKLFATNINDTSFCKRTSTLEHSNYCVTYYVTERGVYKRKYEI